MRKVFKIIILVAIFTIIILLLSNWYEEETIQEQDLNTNIEIDRVIKVELEETLPKWTETEQGYEVIAKLEIPKINLKTNVLSRYTENALLVSVTRFWGANPNEIGNFCIIGHNYYTRDNMFYKLKKLKVGDEILLTDRKDITVKYTVYSIIKVSPKDISCLSQDTKGKREITLITCTSDSKNRIVVKAVE